MTWVQFVVIAALGGIVGGLIEIRNLLKGTNQLLQQIRDGERF